jgi:hypothetical protein
VKKIRLKDRSPQVNEKILRFVYIFNQVLLAEMGFCFMQLLHLSMLMFGGHLDGMSNVKDLFQVLSVDLYFSTYYAYFTCISMYLVGASQVLSVPF